MMPQDVDLSKSRRRLLKLGGVIGGALLIPGCASNGRSIGATEESGKEEEEVSPAEDLMREHGVLKRILLVYGEAIRRIDAGEELPPKPILDAAQMIRIFVEDYHEKLEEEYLFPRFRKANKLVDLVDVLAAQHQSGRRVTDITLRSVNASLRDASAKGQLRDSMAQFIRMYNPHEAREDTVLF